MIRKIEKSQKLQGVCYDVRGPVLQEAKRLEEDGFRVIKLNIGNPAPFGLEAPEEIIHDVIMNIRQAQGYSDSKGLFAARKAIMHYCQEKGIPGVQVEDIYTGNGVSELIMMSVQALLNDGDEVLIPAPDYPLWTAAVRLSGGKAVHYLCDEESDWYPDLKDMKSKITDKTKAVVLINPNNPTGTVYPVEILQGVIELARSKGLVVFSDEIYDKILYDGLTHTSTASLASDLLFITFNGLSKNYRIAGFRGAWMILSGNKALATHYVEGLDILSSMRLCSNVTAQLAIQTALGGYQSIKDLVAPGGRLCAQRDLTYKILSQIPGVSCVKPKAAFYCFPKLDPVKYAIENDEKFVLDLLLREKVLLVQGTAFNWPNPDHFRVVFLPRVDELKEALGKLAHFLESYKPIKE